MSDLSIQTGLGQMAFALTDRAAPWCGCEIFDYADLTQSECELLEAELSRFLTWADDEPVLFAVSSKSTIANVMSGPYTTNEVFHDEVRLIELMLLTGPTEDCLRVVAEKPQLPVLRGVLTARVENDLNAGGPFPAWMFDDLETA